MDDKALIQLNKAQQALLEAKSLFEVKELIDKAEAARVYAERVGASDQTVNSVMEFKIDCARKAGEMLASPEIERERQGGDRRSKSRPAILKLTDLGITPSQASRWQRAGSIEEGIYRDWVEKVRDKEEKLSLSALLRFAKQLNHDVLREEFANTEGGEGLVKDLSEVFGQMRCIYADPPWSYGDSKVPGGGVENQYPTMTLDEICELPVGDLAHEDGCHLWLWTTWPMIREKAPHRVLDAWGFRWVGEIVWKKQSKKEGRFFGVGRWLRPSTEILILSVKKKLPLLSKTMLDGCYFVEQPVRGHSRKPTFFRKHIEKLSPNPRIELFAREAVEGWYRWGFDA